MHNHIHKSMVDVEAVNQSDIEDLTAKVANIERLVRKKPEVTSATIAWGVAGGMWIFTLSILLLNIIIFVLLYGLASERLGMFH